MKKIMLAAFMMLLLYPVAYTYGFSSKGEDCSKCHTLTKDEAATLLKDIIPNGKILDVRMTQLKALWEVDVETQGRKMPVYVDFSKKYLVSGTLIDIKGKKNLTEERLSEINRVDASKIPLKDALVMGSKDARDKVIVFTDPDCPYCAKLHDEIKKVIMERKDIAFFIKMFPLPSHKGAFEKSKVIVCEKSLSLLDDAFAKKQLPKANCKTTAIDDNIKLAKKLGITGTPAMVMPDGRVVSGYRDANVLKNLIDRK
ncbi:MAG: DsbC family protein [Nitrospirae bacterium]|nr:DsbC family protein [Nitrospirota bacterium]